ncbi:PAS domain-containing sensor histidine kinase [Sediminicola sp. 1XM1-17]|uniref:PAS domain-containing sensor histidine kinase n=1 Tax=Sediminicola sp. 1XM1-17 TaxID=3127702 RepID=UPI003077A1E3
MKPTHTKTYISEAPLPISALDQNLCFIEYSDLWNQEFGIGDRNLEGEHIFDSVPNTSEEVKEAMNYCLKGNSFAMEEQKIFGPESAIHWLKWKINPWRKEDGSVGGLIVVVEDISQGKRQKEMLKKAESVANIGGWEVDLIANKLYWSDSTKEIHELPKNYIPSLEEGINFYKAGEHRDKITELVASGIAEGKPWDTELIIITAKGKELWVRAKGEAELVDGKCIRLFGTFQDIDKDKRAEIEYNKISERLAIATKAANIGIWEYDFSRSGHYWSDQMYTLYGVGKDEYNGDYGEWLNMIHPEDRKLCHKGIEAAYYGGKEFNGEFRIVWPNGEHRYLKVDSILERDENGIAKRIIGTNWDITALKHAEKQLRDLLEVTKGQNENLTNFAHIVSHNLRSHSSNLSMLTSFLMDEEEQGDQENVLAMLKDASDSLSDTVHHLNEVVQIKKDASQKLTGVDLYNSIQSVRKNISALAKESDVQFEISVPKDQVVQAVPAYVDSILLNLVTNSIKYRDPNKNPKIEISSTTTKDNVILSISDNGLGIDLERHRNKIFGMYKTFHKHEEAKGIGLFITKNQIEAMNGKIEVESTVGKGSTFKLYFKVF